MPTYKAGIHVGELIAELTALGQPDALVSLALMETEKPPHETLVCLMVEHNGGGTVVLVTPLDMEGLPSQRHRT